MTPTDRAGEREAIVAWLRADAEEYRHGGDFWKAAYAAVRQAARAIERGDHLKEPRNG